MLSTAGAVTTCTSGPNVAAAAITLSSWLPAWLTTIDVPSLVQTTPHGLPAPKDGSSNPIVRLTFCCRVSITLTTLLLIQPCSTCRGINSKLETRCVT